MARYPWPIKLPANPGDSVEFRPVTCNYCQHRTTVAIERIYSGEDLRVCSSVPICCDEIARRHHQIVKEIDA